MGTAVALVVEASRPGGGDHAILNDLLADVSPVDLPVVTASVVVLASTLGGEWAVHDAEGPREVLAAIGLATARKSL
ncbi:hypothetical protein [Actinomadura rupiterrae]|uniref:hypothetical protein n=1 Tax=Actinomadura rupiterrae TaxID=559627 RepID=UPI0020A58132|nr:hypothetical protein [Actinomadura rupiterrae]MCP2336135.1 hypothetical protein [Actinomadura rupiterrae]